MISASRRPEITNHHHDHDSDDDGGDNDDHDNDDDLQDVMDCIGKWLANTVAR